MAEEILVNITPREARIALLNNGVLQEVHIERTQAQGGVIGNIYKGRVRRLLVGLQAAFVDIGLERSAFLHISNLSAPSTVGDIRQLLHPGQELLVQVYKDPLGSKGARLTTQFTLPARYLVLTPTSPQINVSQKITDEAERTRLAKMVMVDSQGGFILRTAAVEATEKDLAADRIFLKKIWQDILERSKKVKVGGLVYEEIPIILRVLRDLAGHKVEKIRVDQLAAVHLMRDFAKNHLPSLLDRIEYYNSPRPIFDMYSVEDEIQKALQRKVFLKSGGYLIFDQTEAMTTIDVNTGSYLGHGVIEETIFKTNLEALEVIARQVRLRNLGGIIIIDFIDMSDPNHKNYLLELLRKSMAQDSARVEISELSSLGLVQMTRKRTRESLERILCVACPLCQRRGSIKSLQTLNYEILREIKRMSENYPWAGFTVLGSQALVNTLLEEDARMLADLELQLNRPIRLQVEPSYAQEQYDILPLAEKM